MVLGDSWLVIGVSFRCGCGRKWAQHLPSLPSLSLTWTNFYWVIYIAKSLTLIYLFHFLSGSAWRTVIFNEHISVYESFGNTSFLWMEHFPIQNDKNTALNYFVNAVFLWLRHTTLSSSNFCVWHEAGIKFCSTQRTFCPNTSHPRLSKAALAVNHSSRASHAYGWVTAPLSISTSYVYVSIFSRGAPCPFLLLEEFLGSSWSSAFPYTF